jgi:glycosyltransferase involved in cell wall biosynthesis
VSKISSKPTLKTDGKFFRIGHERVWLRTVTYGPFPPDRSMDHLAEFARIRSANFNSIRLFSLPEKKLLDAAADQGLLVFAGLNWNQYQDFVSHPRYISSAIVQLTEWLNQLGSHPALAGIYIANEIPTDLVRWMGPGKVKAALERLIEIGRGIAPHLLFAYANYPSTEYLELDQADFTAFNIYLEQPVAFGSYLKRLQNIAGDRPLVVSEFGLDSIRNSPETQSETFSWALSIAHAEETAGFTAYAWSDLWFNAGMEITDWSFGITDRNGNPKPAFHTCRDFKTPSPSKTKHTFSVIVCTRNGAKRIASCLRAIASLAGGPFETIVVNDGSMDDTAQIVAKEFPEVRLINLSPSGLSAARNIGAEHATGKVLAYTDDDCLPDHEWLFRLDRAFENPNIAAAGGPNLPPHACSVEEAIVNAAPGAPSHVLIDDTRAEHLPGCNIAIRRSVFYEIDGFNPVFETAGDDVDFCWRLHDANHELAFVPGAFVWHHRRPTICGFFKQQIGYGRAERLLIKLHPHRFSKQGEALWNGFVYSGGPIRIGSDSVIYHGPMGQAGYQSISNHMLPLRALDYRFKTRAAECVLKTITVLHPIVRSWFRNRSIQFSKISAEPKLYSGYSEFSLPSSTDKDRDNLLRHLLSKGWKTAGESDDWDLENESTRILIATEKLDHQHLNHLIRIWGYSEPVIDTMKQFLHQS